MFVCFKSSVRISNIPDNIFCLLLLEKEVEVAGDSVTKFLQFSEISSNDYLPRRIKNLPKDVLNFASY